MRYNPCEEQMGLLPTNIEELRKKYRSDNFIAFSMDVDWASDYCIAELTTFLTGNNIPLTIFCTHPSGFLSAQDGNPMIELGIHPNYCPGSDQGSTIEEVTDYCMKLVPKARCVRGHRWFNSNDMYDLLVQRGICFDSSECSMMDSIEPYIHRSGMLRLPVFFEDGALLQSEIKPDFAVNGKDRFSRPGLKVLDLHPIHFVANSPTLQYYRDISDGMSRGEYGSITKEQAESFRYRGRGIRDYVMDLVDFIMAKKINVVSLGQVYDELKFFC